MEDLDITKNQVIDTITEYINPLMEEKSFKWMKTKKAFIKKTNFGYLELSYNITNYWPLKQDLKIYLAVKYNNIQKIFSLFSDNKETINHETIAESLVLPNSNELEYKELYTVDDLELAKVESLKIIKESAFDFFEKYSDITNVTNDYRNRYNTGLHFRSLIKYAILLKVCKLEEEYNEIKNNKESHILKSWTSEAEPLNNEEKRELLDKVFDYLENNTFKFYDHFE